MKVPSKKKRTGMSTIDLNLLRVHVGCRTNVQIWPPCTLLSNGTNCFSYMASIFESSAMWRKIVQRTKESKSAFLVFGVVCVVVPWGLAVATQISTNSLSEEQLANKKIELSRGRLDGQVF